MKKFLSLILTLALICTMLPTVFAAEADEVKTLEYVFNASAHPGAKYNTTTIETTDTLVSARWGYGGLYGFFDYSIDDSKYLKKYIVFNGKYEDDGEAPGALMPYDPAVGRQRITAIELEVTAAGTYNPSFSFEKSASGLIWEVHLIKNTNVAGTVLSTNNLRAYAKNPSADTRLGFVDLYGSGTGETAFPSVTLEKANYYLFLFPVGTNENIEYSTRSNGYHESNNYFRGFTLAAVPTVGTKYEYNFNSQVFNLSSDNYVSLDDCRETNTLKYYLGEDGTSYKWKEGAWYYSSIDTTKAQVYHYSALERYQNPTKTSGWTLINQTGTSSSCPVTEANLNMYFDIDGQYNGTTVIDSASYFALKLNVPNPGKYSVSILPQKYTSSSSGNYSGVATNVYIFKDNGFSFSSWSSEGKTADTKVKHYTDEASVIEYEFNEAGHYIFVFELDDNDVYQKPKISATEKIDVRYLANLKQITLEYKEATAEQKEINDEKTEVILPGNDGETETVKAGGSIKVLTADISTKTGTVNSDLSVENAEIGAEYEITAPKLNGKEFLYWAKGIGLNKAGFSEEETVKINGEIGATWLTAVYRDANSENISVEFYNANGELWSRSDTTYTEGDAITFPENPTLTGYTFTGWKLAGGGDKLVTSSDDVTATGSEMLFVAQYEDKANDVTVKVNGENKTYAYGESVTLTAASRSSDGAGIFAYWQKKADSEADAEIVSFDKAYTFRAYDGCEVEAVYRAYETPAQVIRKILLGTSGKLNIAEFIGISGAAEKGIIFGSGKPTVLTATHKIKMNGDGDYLSALNDVSGVARAYVIFENSEVLYSE